jgi:hypothetical protein
MTFSLSRSKSHESPLDLLLSSMASPKLKRSREEQAREADEQAQASGYVRGVHTEKDAEVFLKACKKTKKSQEAMVEEYLM